MAADSGPWQPLAGLHPVWRPAATAARPLHYRQLDSSHPLYQASAAQADSLSARRCRFVLDDAPMVVCEVFLPALKDFAR
jgi:chorismate-pyruvate lyase